MAFLSHSKKEIKAKIVYYGPGLSGKTSNIEFIHDKMRSDHRGELVNLSTSDRTLFFDFLPVELGNIKGYRTRFHIFTVPGQVFYNETRKSVLRDVDGIVFVADSQKKMRDDNIRSLKNLEENLASYGKKLQDIPHVFQYNKRDLPDALTIEDLHRQLNKTNAPFFEAVATQGNGILNTLKLISKMVLKKLATAPTNTIEESDEAFEENNYGLGQEYVVVQPGAQVDDNEAVVHAVEVEISTGDVVTDASGDVAPATEAIEGAPLAGEPEAPTIGTLPVAPSVTDETYPLAESPESYEAEIPEHLDESEIPPPPPYAEAVTELDMNPTSIAEAMPEPAEVAQKISMEPPQPAPEPLTPMQQPVAPSPVPEAMAKAPGASELELYQWGFPERVGPSSIKIPIYFRDTQTHEEYWSYITISLDNIYKRL